MRKRLLSVALMAALSISSVGAAEMSKGNLFDVTKGKEIRNVVFENSAVGGDAIAHWNKEKSEFVLRAEFTNLPKADGDDFYEGWLVQKSPFKFISTGKVTLDDEGSMVNIFTSGVDYSSYNFYVLTLEPNDGDPAPADHIVEGTIPVTMKVDVMMDKDDSMMKAPTMMEKDEMKMKAQTSKYYLPIKKILSKYGQEQLKRIHKNIPKIKTLYKNRTNISESRRMKVLEIIEIIELTLLESMEMMMEK